MAFSQSFSLGENTLNQLDICEINVKRVDTNVIKNKLIKTMKDDTHRSINKKAMCNSDILNQTPSLDSINSSKILEVIDESPTEKSNILGQSIRERLQTISSSRKSDRKYMRRSRSDPISITISHDPSNVLTESCGSMFDVTADFFEEDGEKSKKAKVKLNERFENDDFDKYFGDIKTPKIRQGNQNSSLIAMSDSDGDAEQINISKIEQLMHTENQIDFAEPKEEIEWEDSAFFNDLPTTQKYLNCDEKQEKDDSLADFLIDAECVSMQNEQREVEMEMESCFLEVSIQLTNLNATEAKSMNKTGTQLDTSISSRNITNREICSQTLHKTEDRHNLSLISNKLSIKNIAEWSCSPSIIKMYKKKGLENMFEWQAECLNMPSVSLEISFTLIYFFF